MLTFRGPYRRRTVYCRRLALLSHHRKGLFIRMFLPTIADRSLKYFSSGTNVAVSNVFGPIHEAFSGGEAEGMEGNHHPIVCGTNPNAGLARCNSRSYCDDE